MLIGALILTGDLNWLFAAYAALLIVGCVAYAWFHLTAKLVVKDGAVFVHWIPPVRACRVADVVGVEQRRVGVRLITPVLVLADGRHVPVRALAGTASTIDHYIAELEAALEP